MIMVVPVTFRRKAPTTAFWIGVAGGGLQALTKGGPSPADVAIIVLLYTLAAYRPRSQSVPGLLVAIAGSMVALEYWMADSWAQARHMLLTGLVVYGSAALLAWVLGDSMRYRRAYYVALEDRAARLERERDIQAQIGAAAERARIARELHDVVAHNVSVMVVQADGAGCGPTIRPPTWPRSPALTSCGTFWSRPGRRAGRCRSRWRASRGRCLRASAWPPTGWSRSR
jgi:hypothetical protein